MKNIIKRVELCPKCGKNTFERRAHKKITDKMRRQPYFFKEWDVCTNCRFIQHYEEFKVWNNNDMASYIKNAEEIEEQTAFVFKLR